MTKTYPKIEIQDRSHGVTDRKEALKISNRLAVSYSNKKYDRQTYKIFSIIAQKPLLDCRFENIEDAIHAAIMIEEVYGQYLDIFEADPDIEVLMVSQYSIPGGVMIYSNLEELEDGDDVITLEDMKRALEVVK